MKRAAIGLLLCNCFVWAGEKPTQWLLITNANLVDTRDGAVHPNLTVVVKDGVIHSVVKIAVVNVGLNVRVINANGKFLIPAPWDSRASVDPLEALEAVKYKPNLSAIRTGQAANLVLVERYPAADVRQYLKVEGLVLRGSYYSRSDLDKLTNAPGGADRSLAESRTSSAP